MQGSYPRPSGDYGEMTVPRNDYNRPNRQSIEDWQQVAKHNIVARRVATARFKLGDLGNRGGIGLRALYLAGPPGVGKTHSIVEQESAWRAKGLEPIRFRPQTARELLDYFMEARGSRPMIMEEADIIFRSKAMFEILKQATDPLTPDALTRIVKIDGEKVAIDINLNVPIVVTTNMDLLSDKGWSSALLGDRDALFNRSRPIVIPDDALALWEWSIYLALCSDLTKTIFVRNPTGGKSLEQSNPLSVQAAAMDWFTTHVNQLAVISPRTLKQVSQIFGRAHRRDMPEEIFSEELSGLLGPEREQSIPVPEMADWAALLKAMPKQHDEQRRSA